MKKCLVVIDMQNGFIKQGTEHLPNRIIEFIEHSSFERIVATRYCNTFETACYKLGNWKECMVGTYDVEIISQIRPFVHRVFEKQHILDLHLNLKNSLRMKSLTGYISVG